MRSTSIVSFFRHTDSLRFDELILWTSRDGELPGPDECLLIAPRNRRSAIEWARTALSLVDCPLRDSRKPVRGWFVTKLPASAPLEHRRNYFTNDQVLEAIYAAC